MGLLDVLASVAIKGRCGGVAQRARIVAQKKNKNRTSEQHANKIRVHVRSQGGWNMRGGQKCRARHTACKSKVRINERQAERIRTLRGVLDVFASITTKDMPWTKRLNKLYLSAAKYIKQLNIVELRHLVCAWWMGHLVAALLLSM